MRTRRVGIGLVILLGAGLAAASGCSEKTRAFFQPLGIDLVGDETPPSFVDFLPPPSVTVLNASSVEVTAVDEGSGIETSTATATLTGGIGLPITATALGLDRARLVISLDPVEPETAAKIGVTVEDRAGNEGRTSFDFLYDPLPPRITAGFPTAPIESSEEEVTFTLPVSIVDASFASAIVRLAGPGADGTCGTGDDEPVAEGTDPGEVEDAEQEFSTPGFDATFRFFNPVGAGGDPLQARLCVIVEAFDSARNAQGEAAPNVGRAVSGLDLVLRGRSLFPAGAAFLGIPGGDGELPAGTYTVDVRDGFGGTVVGTVEEEFRQTGPNKLLFRNPDHLGMTDVARVVHLDRFTLASGGGALAPAQATSPLVGFGQYGWCSELDLLQFGPAVVRMRDAGGALVHQQNLTSLPDNPAGTADPVCGFVNVPEPDRVVEIELDTAGTHVRLIGACQRNAPASDLEGPCRTE